MLDKVAFGEYNITVGNNKEKERRRERIAMETKSSSESMYQMEDQTEDIREYLKLLRLLTDTERKQFRGIMIGLQLAKQQDAAKVVSRGKRGA